MATVPASTRLPDWLEREIRRFWQQHGEGPSVALRRTAEEWWTVQEFPAIEFRDGVSGRRAALREGPDVWEVVMVAQAYGGDVEQVARHFGQRVSRTALEQAIAYAERFPDEITNWINENERVARLLARRSR